MFGLRKVSLLGLIVNPFIWMFNYINYLSYLETYRNHREFYDPYDFSKDKK